MKKLLLIILVLLATPAIAKRQHPERDYQQQWCNAHGGQLEYTLPDRTRVDCLTDSHAIEFDFADKWAESIGQALYYGLQTNRRPGVVLILEHAKDQRYLQRLRTVAEKHGIDVWLIGKE